MLYRWCLNSGYIFLMVYIWFLVSWQCTEKMIWGSEGCSGSPWKQLRKAVQCLESGKHVEVLRVNSNGCYCSSTCSGIVYYSIVIQELLWIWSGLSCGHLILFCVPDLEWLALFQLAAFRADTSRCIDLSSLVSLKLRTWHAWEFMSQLCVPVAFHFCCATVQFHSCR